MMELMISAAVLGVVMAGLLGLSDGEQRTPIRAARARSTLQQNVRVALERMGEGDPRGGVPSPASRHVACDMPARGGGGLYPNRREARTEPCWSFYPVVGPDLRTRMTLQYDWNGDGVITTVGKVNDPINCSTGAACRGEQVTYSLVGHDS